MCGGGRERCPCARRAVARPPHLPSGHPTRPAPPPLPHTPNTPTLVPPPRSNAYNMVVNKYGERLYRGLVETETSHLGVVAARIEEQQGESFLRLIKAEWEAHIKAVQMIRDILMYMDRIYVKQQARALGCRVSGLQGGGVCALQGLGVWVQGVGGAGWGVCACRVWVCGCRVCGVQGVRM